MKLNLRIAGRTLIASFAAALSIATASAQTTATFINPAGGEWNVPGNWDLGLAPGNATNALISTNAVGQGSLTVTYDTPMTAANLQTLTNKSATFVINTSGFNVVGGGGNAVVLYAAARLLINNNGALNITGGMNVTSNSAASLAVGGTLSVSGTMAVALGGNSSSGGGAGSFTNFGGNMTVGTLNVNNGSGNQNGLCIINGGTNTFNTVNIGRSSLNPFSTPGPEGLLISNGIVTIGALNIGGAATAPANSYLTFQIAGGIVTNTANIRIHQQTSGRQSRFFQTGGRYVLVDPSVVTNDPSSLGGIAQYSVLGGTNVAAGLSWGWLSNGVAQLGTVNFTNAANVFLGSAGIVSNGAVVLNCALNNGGRFGAYADWTNFATLTINGGSFDCQDVDGTPHNIYNAGIFRGGGTFTKTGPGLLTFLSPNTFTGTMIVLSNSVVVANDGVISFGSLPTASITVARGATFDVSQMVNGFVLGGTKTIAGVGTVVGTFGASDNSIVSPAGIGAQGTLAFANGLAATNATFSLELTDNPSGLTKTNDAVQVTGNLTLSGVNSFLISPLGSLGIGTYKLITYSGSLVGSLANFSVPPSIGTLSNGLGEIDLIVSQVRPVATVLWRGDGGANLWDTGVSSNWLNGASADRFYTGDTTVFDDSATNFTVFESGQLFPATTANITVKGTNYTFTGDGSINGTTGLIKTNSGILIITSTNNYTGVTTVTGGGTIAVTNMFDAGVSGPLGAGTSATNLVLDNGTLRYDGGALTVARGFTVGPNGGTIDITNSVTLTISNNVTGPGALTKVGNGTLNMTVLSDYAGGTVLQNGTLRATQGNNATINSLGTNSVTLVGTNANGPVTFAFGNNGETLVNPLIIQGTNNVNLTGNNTISGLSGDGYVQFNGASDTLSLRSVDSSTFTGTLFANNLSFIRFNLSSGTSANYANTIIDLGINSTILVARDGVTCQIGALTGNENNKIESSTTSTAQSTYIIGSRNIDTVFSGWIIDSNNTGRAISLIKVGSGTFTLNGGTNTTTDPNTFQDVTVFTNQIQYIGQTVISNGVLAMIAPASLTNSASVTLATSSAVLDMSQAGDPDPTWMTIIPTGYFEAVAGHSVGGLGTIRGGLLADAGSRVNVGLPGTTGVLTVTNNVTLNGTTSMKVIKGNTPSSDELVSSTAGSITYGGALVVTNGGGALAVNDTFTLFGAASLSGAFTSTNLPAGYAWDTSRLNVDGTIKVTAVLAVTPPQFTVVNFISLTSGTITFSGTGSANGPVSLRSSTDVATPLSSWTVVATGNFDGSGNYSTNLTVNALAPKVFYILSVP